MAVVERRRMVFGFQPPPGEKSSGALIAADATEVEVRIPTEWLEALGWRRERPELIFVLDSRGIHITPAHSNEAGDGD